MKKINEYDRYKNTNRICSKFCSPKAIMEYCCPELICELCKPKAKLLKQLGITKTSLRKEEITLEDIIKKIEEGK